MSSLYRKSSKDDFLQLFPEPARAYIDTLLLHPRFRISVTQPRKMKHGSFSVSGTGKTPVIRLNNNMGPCFFMVVFLHELAHFNAWEKHGRNHLPHGPEWKEAFRDLLSPLLFLDGLDAEFRAALKKHMVNVPATFNRYVTFTKLLHRLDNGVHIVTLSDIPDNTSFRLKDGKVMVKIARIRTRYKCYCPANRRYYLVSPLAEIVPLDKAV